MIPVQKLAALGAKIGFSLVRGQGGATELVTLHLGGAGGTHDVETDTMVGGGTDKQVNAIAFRSREAQTGTGSQTAGAEFSLGTDRLLIEQAELGAGVIIQETDSVTRADGSKWAILVADQPPGKAVWLLDIRK